MARKPRVHLPGGLYHVMLRGNGGQDLFFVERDRTLFTDLLAAGRARYDHRIHGYCLMTNHVHLVLQAGAEPLARALQNLSFRYARRINRATGRGGHLFQGRYQARLVDSDAYLLALMRYVHLNPVRAGLAKHPGRYPWSSHRPYLGEARPDWLTCDWVLSCFAKREPVARRRFAAFVESDWRHMTESEAALDQARGRLLGPDDFIERALDGGRASGPPSAVPSLETVIAQVASHSGLSPGDLSAPGRGRRAVKARALAAYLVQASGAGSLSVLAEIFGRDLSTLSRASGGVARRLDQDERLAQSIAALQNAIMQA